jgi:hypothetical protein
MFYHARAKPLPFVPDTLKIMKESYGSSGFAAVEETRISPEMWSKMSQEKAILSDRAEPCVCV